MTLIVHLVETCGFIRVEMVESRHVCNGRVQCKKLPFPPSPALLTAQPCPPVGDAGQSARCGVLMREVECTKYCDICIWQ